MVCFGPFRRSASRQCPSRWRCHWAGGEYINGPVIHLSLGFWQFMKTFILITLAALLLPLNALAIEEEWTLGGGPLFATIPDEERVFPGLGGRVFARYGLTDSMGLDFGLRYAHHFGQEAASEEEEAIPDVDLLIPNLGFFYALDIITFVPYLVFDATFYLGDSDFDPSQSEAAWGVGIAAGLGLQYRGWRDFSLGAEFNYHAFLADIADYPVYIDGTFFAAWHSDPF